MQRDKRTLDLFYIPEAPANAPGALDLSIRIRSVLAEAIKASGKGRERIADAMSELTNQRINKTNLDAWTAESRKPWKFPLEYLPAFEIAADTYSVTEHLAQVRGCRVLIGRESLNADLGRLELARDEAARKIRELKRAIGEGA